MLKLLILDDDSSTLFNSFYFDFYYPASMAADIAYFTAVASVELYLANLYANLFTILEGYPMLAAALKLYLDSKYLSVYF